MDSSGKIHDLGWLPSDDREKRLAKLRALTMREGPVEPIADRDLPTVQAMDVAERRAWFEQRRAARERRAKRKRERRARKGGR